MGWLDDIEKAQSGKTQKKVLPTRGPTFRDINENVAVQAAKMFDPTGISSWPDVYYAAKDYKEGKGSLGNLAMNVFGALPVVGKVGRAASAASKLSKALSKVSKVEKALDKVEKVAPGIAKVVGNIGGDIAKHSRGKKVNPIGIAAKAVGKVGEGVVKADAATRKVTGKVLSKLSSSPIAGQATDLTTSLLNTANTVSDISAIATAPGMDKTIYYNTDPKRGEVEKPGQIAGARYIPVSNSEQLAKWKQQKMESGGKFDGLTNKGFNYNGAWGGPAQGGKKVKPLVVTSENDPRYKSYQDSLRLYNFSERANKNLPEQNVSPLNKDMKESWEYSSIKPIGQKKNKQTHYKGETVYPVFKEPQQPVVVKSSTTKKQTTTKKADATNSGYTLQHDGSKYYDLSIPKGKMTVEVIDPDTGDRSIKFVDQPSEKRAKVKPIQKSITPVGIQSDFELEADIPNIPTQARLAKYFNIDETNQPAGGTSHTQYQYWPSRGDTLREDPSYKRTITPVYESGGSMPGSVGFSYARDGAPSNGKNAKKTLPSAQDGIKRSDPRYEELYKQGMVQRPEATGEPGAEFWGGELDPAIVPAREKGFWRQSIEAAAKEADSPLGAIASTFTYPLGLLKQATMYGLTGKVQEPSEALGVENPIAALATDLMLDPVDILTGGAAAISKIGKLGKLRKLGGLSKLDDISDAGKTADKIPFVTEITPEDWGKWHPQIPNNPDRLAEYAAIEEATKDAGTWMKTAEGDIFPHPKEFFVQSQSGAFKKAFPEGYNTTYRGLSGTEEPTLAPGRSMFTANRELADFYAPSWDKDVNITGPNQTGIYNLVYPKTEGNLSFDTQGSHFMKVNLNPTAQTDEQIDYSINWYQDLLRKREEAVRSAVRTEEGDWLLPSGTVIDDAMYHNMGKLESKKIMELEAMKGRGGGLDVSNPDLLAQMRADLGERTVTDDIAKYMEDKDINNVIIKNIEDGAFGDVNIVKHKEGHYLKSIFGNIGDFDMSNPNIFKSIIGAGATGAGTYGVMGGDEVPQYKSGGVIKDNMGFWNPNNEGKIVEIGSNTISTDGMSGPVYGVSDKGDERVMYPGELHEFKGKKVREKQLPIAKDGNQLTKLDQLTNFTNYNKPQPGGWLDQF